MEDNQNEQRSKWKTTKMKEVFPPPKKKTSFSGTQLSRKLAFQESRFPGKRHSRKAKFSKNCNFDDK